MKIKKLTIIIPVYNEAETVEQILIKVRSVKYSVPVETIIVNDGSTDATGKKLQAFVKRNHWLKYYQHEKNAGKGAALKTGISQATGDYIVVQDADLEYNPEDINRLIDKLHNSDADAVYGSRLTEPPVLFGSNRTPILLHYFGNKFLSLVASLLYFTWLTDMETCYKLFPRSVVQKMNLRARAFEFEPEITAKLLKRGLKIVEIPITTKPRGFEEGKKLNTWKDGRRALGTLLKYRFVD